MNSQQVSNFRYFKILLFVEILNSGPVQQLKARARRESIVKPTTPVVFCELLELSHATHEELFYWKEKARWIKYEETVEKSGKRWSKPHIPLVNAVSVFQLRNCIKRGAVLLDIAVDSYVELIGRLGPRCHFFNCACAMPVCSAAPNAILPVTSDPKASKSNFSIP